MSDLEFNLSSGTACPAGAGAYHAKAFVRRPGYPAAPRWLYLGTKHPPEDDTAAVSDRVRALLPPQERSFLVAMSVLKLCEARRHRRQALERMASYVLIADMIPSLLPIKPYSLHTDNGIGSAQCKLPGSGELNPVIDLPTLATERDSYLTTTVIEAHFSTPGNRAYVALRGFEHFVSV